MPGAGINSANIAAIRGATGADEFHASAKRTRTSATHWRPNRLIDMQGGELRSDCDEIWQMRAALSRAVRAT
jgi:copper homeostasis protein